ncbi:MAG: fibronectin type III domain-containing protein [Cyclobacteriaceae bacterium]|nr:fibronectin type III domain-containing protein [Cyclobacteriaceae bacterium]
MGTFFLLPLFLSAQSVGNYSVNRTTGITYNSIINSGNSFASWRNTGSFSVDDNRSEATDIGFDFWYNGQRYTQFSVSTNGFLDFSSSADDGGPQCDDYGYCNANFTSSNISSGTWLALAPFYDDMTTRDGVDPLGTSIKYQVSGTAPNRILTVEWDGMAVYQNTTPDINFQVKLHETSGLIEYVYETMNNGNVTFSYTIGMNASTVSNPPTVAQLLTQQTANTTSFNNTPQNNLSTMPAANSSLQFLPPAPADPTGSLTFTGLTNSGMTLNWSDWASNEVGYAIYYSTDDINYFFSSQTAANTTSSTLSGLLPGTTYYWRVYAVTEGTLSNALTANATTLAPATIISVSSSRWDNASTWDCNCIPTAGDNVIIQDGHNVTIRAGGLTCNDLTIGQGSSGSLQFIRNTARDLTVNGNLTINPGATFDVRTNSNATHILNIRGNITNNGTLNLMTDSNSKCAANFVKADGNQTVIGNGTTGFYTITVDKNLKSNMIEIATDNFSCNSDALNFASGGTFKFSSAGTNNFTLSSTDFDIPSKGLVWMNSTNSTMNFGANVTLTGDLKLDDGTLLVGNAADENIISNGGFLEVNGGALAIAGRYDRSTTESTFNFIQTNGTITLPSVGSTSATRPPFGMDVIGSSMTISGGILVLQQAGGVNLGYTTSGVTSSAVSGGTLQIGNSSTPVAQIIQVDANIPVYNLLVANTNATLLLFSNNMSVQNNITLTAGSLSSNSLDITVGGDWLANGGSFIPAIVGTVTLNGGNQSVTTNGSAFNNLTLAGTGTKFIQDNLTVNGNLTINTTLTPVNTGSTLTIGGNWVNNGVFSRNNETILFNGLTDQAISGSGTNDFTNITINKITGSVINQSNLNLYQTLDIQSATTFEADGGGSGSFSLLSSALEESRVAPLPTGASITGNVRAEKYLPVYGSKRWRNISIPVLGASVADIQNEIPVSGNFSGSDNGSGGIPSYATGSLAYYNNTIGDDTQTLDDRWVLYPSTDNLALLTTTGNEAQGYAIWIRDLGAVTFDVTGSVNQGTIDFHPTGSHERWNLMGNPYPSSINWDASGWTKTGIQGNAIFIWDGLQYKTWNGSMGDLPDGTIAKGQSFWVQGSQDAITLTATETVKAATTGTTYRTGELSYLELLVSDKTYTDKTYVYLATGAKPEFDQQDASKLLNSIFSFSSLSSDSSKLSINAISPNICHEEIPLVLENIWQGSFSLEWNNIHSLPAYLNLTITDRFTEQSYNLKTDNKIDFDITADPQSSYKYRFLLKINSQEVNASLVTFGEQECGTHTASISIENTQPDVLYSVFNSNNEQIGADYGSGDILEISVDSTFLTQGENNFTVHATAGSCSETWLNPVSFTMIETPAIEFDESTNSIYTQHQPGLQWFKDATPIEAQGDTLIFLDDQAAKYLVEVASNKCSLLSESFIVADKTGPIDEEIITSISPEEALNEGISVYPNPFSTTLKVELTDVKENSTSLELLDSTGKRLKQVAWSPEIRFETSNLAGGIYYLKVIYADSLKIVRLYKN